MWLTVPVRVNLGDKINEIEIDNSGRWYEKHKKAIYVNYCKSPFFDKYWHEIERIYDKKYDKIIDINFDFIKLLLDKLDIKTEVLLSSKFGITKTGSDKILEICKTLKADNYLSGISGKKYLQLKNFENNNIVVNFQNFQHPTYRQVFDGFIPNMAIIDLMFNEGDNSKQILSRNT